MIYITKNKFRHIPGKWDVINTKLNTHDTTFTFKEALVFFLWNHGMSFRKASKLLNLNPNDL